MVEMIGRCLVPAVCHGLILRVGCLVQLVGYRLIQMVGSSFGSPGKPLLGFGGGSFTRSTCSLVIHHWGIL